MIDPRDIDGVYGNLAAAQALIDEAHELGLHVIVDVVPNHTSGMRPWFASALAGGPGCPERARYHFRDGRGEQGELPPNNWISEFGGSTWTRITEPDGQLGQWYQHLFSPEQPDLNWDHPEVKADFDETLRFWLDRGVDGFRVDVAHYLVKDASLPDLKEQHYAHGQHPHWDREALHDIFRGWRRIVDAYRPPRVLVAEAWLDNAYRLVRYLRAGELHTAFNFDFLASPWLAEAMRTVIDETLAAHQAVGAAPTWVLSNHDVVRHVSRYARAQVPGIRRFLDDFLDRPADLALGTRRARVAIVQMVALPGCVYVYQGEELGLPEERGLRSRCGPARGYCGVAGGLTGMPRSGREARPNCNSGPGVVRSAPDLGIMSLLPAKNWATTRPGCPVLGKDAQKRRRPPTREPPPSGPSVSRQSWRPSPP